MAKRQATTELNHENWDQDDPADNDSSDQCDNESGTGFKLAAKNVLDKRIIRTAKRRTQPSGDEPKKSIFGGFGGFMKAQPASFDFLSKLTNGNNENNKSTGKTDSPVSASLFTSNKPSASQDTGFFSLQTSPATQNKSPFGSPTGATSLFGVSSSNTSAAKKMFATSKPDSTVEDSPFKLQTVTSSTDNKMDVSKSTTTTTLASSTKFGIPTSSDNVAKSIFSSTSNTPPFNQPTANIAQSGFGIKSKSDSNTSDKDNKSDDSKNESKMKYYSKLKGLNESVCDWIKKHVEQTPLCILSPIFKDYEKYLKEIQDEYQCQDADKKVDNTATMFKSVSEDAKTASNVPKTLAPGPALFNSLSSANSVFTPSNTSTVTESKPKQATFSFGINASATSTSSTITTSQPGFSFGVSTATSQSTSAITSPFSVVTTSSSSSPFAFAANTTTNGAKPFSFGGGKPFSFANAKQNTESTSESKNDEEDDAPPKVEYTPVVEDNSVYEKKCKIFVKKEGNFVDKGVGTLYVKKVEETGKHQLLVRANTTMGTILVNLILVSAIPTQRMGKNNVMMVCIPTPDSKPPPTPILIRVKSSEEADELLTTLDKYKT